MKRSTIFWNVIFLIIEIVVVCMLFAPNIEEAFVTLGVVHSIFLFGYGFDDEMPPIFFMVSFLGIAIMFFGLIIYIVMKIGESEWYSSIRDYFADKLESFNNRLDR